jgi:hypothetical protein
VAQKKFCQNPLCLAIGWLLVLIARGADLFPSDIAYNIVDGRMANTHRTGYLGI